MSLRSRWHNALLVVFVVLAAAIAWKNVVAQDLVHDISGIVKKVDKGIKTVVIKASDGTEHTIKYTDKTVVEGAKDTGKDVAKGSAETYLAAKKCLSALFRVRSSSSEFNSRASGHCEIPGAPERLGCVEMRG